MQPRVPKWMSESQIALHLFSLNVGIPRGRAMGRILVNRYGNLIKPALHQYDYGSGYAARHRYATNAK